MKARKEGNENLNSSVVADTIKSLADSSYDYQIMDRNRHGVTKCLSDEKTNGAFHIRLFKRIGCINDKMYEMELVELEIEHKETNFVGFFILQDAKLRLLEIYYYFFDKYCEVAKFEELGLDTNSLNLALSEHDLYGCTRPALKIRVELSAKRRLYG